MSTRSRAPVFLVLLALVSCCVRVQATVGTNVGVTFDVCTSTNLAFCKTPRSCKTLVDDNIVTCVAGQTCFCLANTLISCTSSTQCDELEQCALHVSTNKQYCISCASVSSFKTLFKEVDKCRSKGDGGIVPSGSGSQSSSPSSPLSSPQAGSSSSPAQGTGYSMDSCRTDGDCARPRQCFFIKTAAEMESCTSSSPRCNCLPHGNGLQTCDTQLGCPVAQETCVQLPGTQGFVCSSVDFVQKFYPNALRAPASSPGSGTPGAGPGGIVNAVTGDGIEKTNDNVCIAAHHLEHLPPHRLVFGAAHRRANVLCDAANSCATPSHVVTFHGETLTMRQYCEYVRCTSQVNVLVNSPALRRGVRIESNTPGLLFTPFAARFETAVERVVIRMLLAAGF